MTALASTIFSFVLNAHTAAGVVGGAVLTVVSSKVKAFVSKQVTSVEADVHAEATKVVADAASAVTAAQKKV
jgi:hypothetical protein